MSNQGTQIIVLTPVKNEDWILKEFLAATSRFADCIIVADQNSSDRSASICGDFEKVVLIKNDSPDFNESERQKILIDKARALFPNDKRILLGLDADEIVAFDSLERIHAWDRIKSLAPGTTLFFEKPDLLPGIAECIRWRTGYFPVGYVDDGAPHSPKEIHSRRIPKNENGKNEYIDEIKFLHFAISRNRVQSAKMRYYSVIENIRKTSPLYLRRKIYRSFFNPLRYGPEENFETVPAEWIDGWLKAGIA
ncbi:MAG TPA: glycosyltransferase family 2 protein, partial [Cyclobacteriaceae bacterium]|nr:glycosyltransferase family 2 protein [Cyclobacteriaceae bacterium]